MYVLGLMGFGGSNSHDAAAAVVRDGFVLAAAEEERFVRKKHAVDLSPVEATLFCLRKAGIRFQDLDAIAYGYNAEGKPVSYRPRFRRDDWADVLFPRDRFPTDSFPEVYYVKHHLAHIASGFYLSGFPDAACICIDGQGESESITLARASGGKIEILREYDRICSLGALFEAGSAYAGLGHNAPGKLMGLAPYGTARHDIPLEFDENTGELRNLLPGLEAGQSTFWEVRAAFENYFERECYPFKPGAPDEAMSYIHVAASVQAAVEDIVQKMARYVRRFTASPNLVLCGGVALNCTCNGVLERSGIFDRIYVPPGANDSSCSIGAALEVCRAKGFFDETVPPRLDDARLGSDYEDAEIEAAFAGRGLLPTRFDEIALCDHVAEALQEGSIILWFQGRAEFGPRALGARSVLANPCSRENHYRVNLLKGREVWRPLAPSVLDRRYAEFFGGSPTSPASFMLKAEPTKPDAQRRVPAVVHVDGSARPQAVRQELNPRYYRLIEAFEKRTGIPLLLNTSLNRRGEPIVNSPEDALAMFMAAPEADVLVIGNYVHHRERS